MGFPGDPVVKNPPAKGKTQVQSLGQEDSLEKRVATHSSILASLVFAVVDFQAFCPFDYTACMCVPNR